MTYFTFLRCAKYVLEYGAAINGRSLEKNDTPLHVAARHGFLGHVDLYLRHGAAVDWQNDEGQTPLNTACSQPHEHTALERYAQVCQRLVEAGANVATGDADKHTPLHMACKNANLGIVVLLLQNGASVNVMNYGGEAPMHNILKMVAYKLEHEPERIVQELLNYGSIRVWPGALPKVSVGSHSLVFLTQKPFSFWPILVAILTADLIPKRSWTELFYSVNRYTFLIHTL